MQTQMAEPAYALYATDMKEACKSSAQVRNSALLNYFFSLKIVLEFRSEIFVRGGYGSLYYNM